MKHLLTFALMAATASLMAACSVYGNKSSSRLDVIGAAEIRRDGASGNSMAVATDTSTSTKDIGVGDVDIRDGSITTNTISRTITVTDFLNDSAVEGVNVCWSLNGGENICVTTDAEGMASGSVEFQAGDMLVLNASKDKFFPFRVEYYLDENTPATANVTWAMIGDALVDIVVAALGAEADETKGHITVLLTDGENPIAGATAEMTTGTPGQGPNYSNSDTANGIFDDGGVTTDAGIVVFNNVEPGEIELTVNVEGKTCTAIAGENTGDNKVGSMIEAGKLTYTSVLCE